MELLTNLSNYLIEENGDLSLDTENSFKRVHNEAQRVNILNKSGILSLDNIQVIRSTVAMSVYLRMDYLPFKEFIIVNTSSFPVTLKSNCLSQGQTVFLLNKKITSMRFLSTSFGDLGQDGFVRLKVTDPISSLFQIIGSKGFSFKMGGLR